MHKSDRRLTGKVNYIDHYIGVLPMASTWMTGLQDSYPAKKMHCIEIIDLSRFLVQRVEIKHWGSSCTCLVWREIFSMKRALSVSWANKTSQKDWNRKGWRPKVRNKINSVSSVCILFQVQCLLSSSIFISNDRPMAGCSCSWTPRWRCRWDRCSGPTQCRQPRGQPQS